MWTKALYDLGLITFDEPFKKLLNQGMIQGSSRFVYRLNIDYLIDLDIHNDKAPLVFVSQNHIKRIEEFGLNEKEILFLKESYNKLNGFDASPHFLSISPLHVDVNIVNGIVLNTNSFREWKSEFANAGFILDDGQCTLPDIPFSTLGENHGAYYICGVETEKMSKSKVNTVNPNDIVEKYGADTFRMYEMFLGPIDQSKPWDTKGIEGVHRFLKKLWRLFFDEVKGKLVTEESATK
ncbi:MAG: leucine--tRNA ligase, partial [Flavobacterium sp.]